MGRKLAALNADHADTQTCIAIPMPRDLPNQYASAKDAETGPTAPMEAFESAVTVVRAAIQTYRSAISSAKRILFVQKHLHNKDHEGSALRVAFGATTITARHRVCSDGCRLIPESHHRFIHFCLLMRNSSAYDPASGRTRHLLMAVPLHVQPANFIQDSDRPAGSHFAIAAATRC